METNGLYMKIDGFHTPLLSIQIVPEMLMIEEDWLVVSNENKHG